MILRTAFVIIGAAVSVVAQQDWSKLFPEISGCPRAIREMVRSGSAVEQIADYGGCGSITLHQEPNLLTKKLQLYQPWHEFFPSTWIKFRGYDTFQGSPLCGNDLWTGSLEVFFDKDKTLTVSAYQGGAAIMEFAEKADLKELGRVIDAR